jgi:hypothetical protein
MMSGLQTKKMSRKQVYLSKSKAGDFDTIVQIKSMLKQFDIDLVEFMGGHYTADLLLNSDIVLLVPPKMPEDNYFNVGKGQFDEYLCSEKTSRIEHYVVLLMSNNLYVASMEGYRKLTGGDWSLNYAILSYDISEIFLLENILDKKQNNSLKPMLALLPKYLKH